MRQWRIAVLILAALAAAAAGISQRTGQAQETEPFNCEEMVRTSIPDGPLTYALVGDTTIEADSSEPPPVDEQGLIIPTDLTGLFFSVGDRQQSCENALPSFLILHRPPNSVPEGEMPELLVNGARIAFDGTIALDIDNERGIMRLIVLRGSARTDDLVVEEGFTARILLEEDGRSPLGIWVGNRPLDDETRAETAPLLTALQQLDSQTFGEGATDTGDPGEEEETSDFTPAPDCEVRSGGFQYIVQPGDTLSGIAVRSGTTVQQLQADNCLPGTLIRVGQRLRTPREPLPRPTATATNTATSTDAPAITPTATDARDFGSAESNPLTATTTATFTATSTDAPAVTPTATNTATSTDAPSTPQPPGS